MALITLGLFTGLLVMQLTNYYLCPGLSIKQSRQMPRAYEGLGPMKVVLGPFFFGPLRL